VSAHPTSAAARRRSAAADNGKTKRGGSSGAAYDLLLAEIEQGHLPPGTRLREVELADRFKLSRTPVREALKRLELQGLVVHKAHHGSVVVTLDYAQIGELYVMREVLEGTAARLAAQHATDVEIDVMREMVERDRPLIGQAQELARTNRLFHSQIRDSARNRFLSGALENLRLALALLAGTTLGAAGRGEQAVTEHSRIVECIANRDPDGAESAARSHIRNAFRTRITMKLGK
jgi:DNA-binding GntR family transcriptional regulator